MGSRYDVAWSRPGDAGAQLECRGLDPRTLAARLINATREGNVTIHRVERSRLESDSAGRVARTPGRIKDAWADVEEVAIQSGVDGKAWIAAVARFWQVADLATDLYRE